MQPLSVMAYVVARMRTNISQRSYSSDKMRSVLKRPVFLFNAENLLRCVAYLKCQNIRSLLNWSVSTLRKHETCDSKALVPCNWKLCSWIFNCNLLSFRKRPLIYNLSLQHMFVVLIRGRARNVEPVPLRRALTSYQYKKRLRSFANINYIVCTRIEQL